MEKEERIIMEEAPPDDSTYFDAEPAQKEKTEDEQGIEKFPFAMTMKEGV